MMARHRFDVLGRMPIGVASLALVILSCNQAFAAAAEVGAVEKISTVSAAGNQFGQSPESIGDLDGDGIEDLAVGVPLDDTGGTDRGAVWIFLLNSNGSVKSQSQIADGVGGIAANSLADGDNFGQSVASLGDLDGDGIGDLAVGAPRDDDGGSASGAVWILFMNSDGTVKAHQKISATSGGFSGPLDSNDRFGQAVAALGDLDGDSMVDLAVGALLDDDGGSDRGAVWILFLNSSGTVKAHSKISSISGGLTGPLNDNDQFASSLTAIGDVDGDGIVDLAVGAPQDKDGTTPPFSRGATWILFLNGSGTVKAEQKISDLAGGFSATLDDLDFFGSAVTDVGDLDGDGVADLAVGAKEDDDGGANRGAVYVLFLNVDGTVKSYQKISDTAGNFTGSLADGDAFGSGLGSFTDLNGDGVADLAVGAIGDDDNGSNAGAVYVLFLQGPLTISGTFTSLCNADMAGIPVHLDLNPTSPGAQVLSTSTDANGDYTFVGVAASGASAELFAIIPLGFGALIPENAQTSVTLDVDQIVDFSLDCLDAVGEPEKLGYWKHQAKVHLKQHDNFEETYDDMAIHYPSAVFSHFYENALNSIAVEGATYIDEGSGPSMLTLDVIHETLRHRADKTDLDKAKAEYLALLLNIASGRLQTFSVVSADGATVSQALQHVATLLNDGDGSNDNDARDLARDINKGKLLGAGQVPLSIQQIAYKPGLRAPAAFELRQNHPNPFNPNTAIELAVPRAGSYEVSIFDAAGKLVRRYHGETQAGVVSIVWDGTDAHGTAVSSGAYFYRAIAGSFTDTRKMILAK